MKPSKVTKSIKKHVAWWVHWLGLGYWNVVIICKKGRIKRGPGEFLAGDTSVSWKYVRAEIKFWPQAMTHLSDQEIENVVVHELMHIFLFETRENAVEHEERVATMLERAFMWVRGADVEENGKTKGSSKSK